MPKNSEELKILKDENIKLTEELEGLKETVAVYLGSLIREVIKVYGNEGKEVIKEAARKGGLWQGQKYIKDNNVTEKGTKAAAEFFGNMSDVDLFKVRTEILSDKKFHIKTSICPYIKTWKEMGIDKDLPDFCIIATYYDLGLCQAFNPNLKISLPEDMLRGCQSCIYEFYED